MDSPLKRSAQDDGVARRGLQIEDLQDVAHGRAHGHPVVVAVDGHEGLGHGQSGQDHLAEVEQVHDIDHPGVLGELLPGHGADHQGIQGIRVLGPDAHGLGTGNGDVLALGRRPGWRGWAKAACGPCPIRLRSSSPPSRNSCWATDTPGSGFRPLITRTSALPVSWSHVHAQLLQGAKKLRPLAHGGHVHRSRRFPRRPSIARSGCGS